MKDLTITLEDRPGKLAELTTFGGVRLVLGVDDLGQGAVRRPGRCSR